MTYIDEFPKKEKETHIPEECKLFGREGVGGGVFVVGFLFWVVSFFKLASSLKTELWAVPVVLIYLILA